MLYPLETASKLSGLSVEQIRRAVEAGEIYATKDELEKIKIDPEELRKFLTTQTLTNPPHSVSLKSHAELEDLVNFLRSVISNLIDERSQLLRTVNQLKNPK